ncbi:unnamed protein product [Fusarium equiseti]|uniref:Uncharacterized protein n=1 Tax=Fusarium equiseti TaxID=61235 RepID=A0A8J2J0L0_FUSEQ|nr:unnamed protein product [Fusarium equiseti]
MEEELHTVQRPKKNRGKTRRRIRYLRRDQLHVSVNIGSLCLCALDHVTPRSMGHQEEPISTHQLQPERYLEENTPYLDVEDSDEEDYVEAFMTKNGTSPRPLCQAETVKTFCHSETLQELISNSPKLPTRKLCLVDDMAIDGLSSTRRAPDMQVVPLTDFFYYYTSFRPHIRFSEKPRGYLNFSPQFHLPFYSWRCTDQVPKDNRRKADGSPLREVFDVRFLRGKASETAYKVDYLCEGQLSVLITAVDQRTYTGYCFVDTYYQPESRRPAVGDYCMSDMSEDSLQTDPFFDGRHDSNMPILDPAEYFFTVLEYQLGVFRNEWTNTVFQIANRVQDYIAKFPYSPPELQSSLSKETQESTVWLRLTRNTLIKLITSLESTIHCWDNHTSKEQSSTLQENRCLESIRETFLDLKIRLFELQNVLRQCDEHERALNLDNIDAQKQVSHLQTTSAISNQTATNFLLHIISPITVAAAMLSMQEKAIPSILGPNKLSFFVLAPILIIFAAAVARLIQSWDRILPGLGQWLKRNEVERRRTMDIELADL